MDEIVIEKTTRKTEEEIHVVQEVVKQKAEILVDEMIDEIAVEEAEKKVEQAYPEIRAVV